MAGLESLLKAIVETEILDHGALLRHGSVGIDPRDWPDFACRDLALSYRNIRAEHSHERAALELAGRLDELRTDTIVPDSAEMLRAVYRESMLEHKGLELARRITAKPRDVESIISGYIPISGERRIISYREQIEEIYKTALEAKKAGKSVVKIEGFPKLSTMVGGFNPGRVGIILAATGFGKTNFATNLAVKASEKLRTLYINMEMIDQDFGTRLLMADSGFEFRDLLFAPEKLEGEIADAMRRGFSKNLFYTDGKSASVEEIEFMIARQATKGLDLVIVDYDQKLDLDYSNRTPEWKELQKAMERLEECAKKNRVCILVLAQEAADGAISGSRRSMFPASFVLRFFLEDDRYLVRAIKNRFGPIPAEIEVNYEPSRNHISEREASTTPVKKAKASVFGGGSRKTSGKELAAGD